MNPTYTYLFLVVLILLSEQNPAIAGYLTQTDFQVHKFRERSIPSCLQNAEAFRIISDCGDGILEKVFDLFGQIAEQIESECILNPLSCKMTDFDRLLNVLKDNTDEVNKVANTLCERDNCLERFLKLLFNCFSSEEDDDGEESFPILEKHKEDILLGLDLLCVKHSDGASCGVKVFEFALIDEFVEGQESVCEPANKTFCPSDCQLLLTAITTNLGCCYAEAVKLLEDLPFEVVSVDLMYHLRRSWSYCEVTPPEIDCHGHKVPMTGSSNSDNLATGAIVGIIIGSAGGLVVVLVITLLLAVDQSAL
eukprot:gene743-4037_t